MGANAQLNLLTIDNNGFFLEVWFPDLFGVALGEADIVAELLALAGEFTLTHLICSLYIQWLILSVFTSEVNMFYP